MPRRSQLQGALRLLGERAREAQCRPAARRAGCGRPDEEDRVVVVEGDRQE